MWPTSSWDHTLYCSLSYGIFPEWQKGAEKTNPRALELKKVHRLSWDNENRQVFQRSHHAMSRNIIESCAPHF
jgi:hypothetical protein